jgi:hypothetical protein
MNPTSIVSTSAAYSCVICCLLALWAAPARAQDALLPDAPQPVPQADTAPQNPAPQNPPSKGPRNKNHIFWIVPDYRQEENAENINPLTPHQKLKMALQDSFDPSAFLVAGIFAGTSMAEDQYPSFGQGAQGFAKYYGGAFADQAIGNTMSEALFPIAFRQDPRYFNKSHGSFWSRTGYAISREVITLGDDKRNHFNISEVGGNAVAAGVSNLYYPAADRSFSNTASKWGQQLGLDTFFNIMKEYWPDMRKKFFGQ